ncbi:MAG: hypothetical protein U0414_20805 [Polyangiaceae bacterium]
MTFFDDLGLRAAEQLESSLGPYVALASYKRMFASRRPTRTKAILGALRCAATLTDTAELEGVVSVVQGEAAELAELSERDALLAFAHETMTSAVALAKSNGRVALELARAIHDRVPTALHAYVVARLEDDAGTRAFDAWFAAVRLASPEPDSAVYRAALGRWLELALDGGRSADGAVRAEMIERALALPIDGAPPSTRLVIARARLLSGSKFQRASGLSLLVELSRHGNDAIRRAAMTVCARHADAAGRLEPIEQERIVAALRNWPDELERESALARLALRTEIDAMTEPSIERAVAILRRTAEVAAELRPQLRRVERLFEESSDPERSAPSDPREPRDVSLGSLAIDALVALRGGHAAEAIRALERAKDGIPSATVVPATIFAVICRALGTKDPAVRRAANALAATVFERRAGAPRQGYRDLGLALARAGFLAEAREVLTEAARLREPDAARWAGELDRRLAYFALAKGDRAAALAGLRRASQHLTPPA